MDSHAVVVGRLPGVARPASSAVAGTPEAATRSTRSRVSRVVGRWSLNLLFVAMIACAAIMLAPAALGFQRYVILTGSMTGTYDRGSVVFDRPVPVSELKVGDPITYAPPPGFTSQTRVSHRIWSIHRGPGGERVFKTKGDANAHPDVWNFTLNQALQDRVVFHIPEVGYLFLLLSLRNFRIVLVGVPCLLIGLFLLRRLWQEGGEEVRRQRLAEVGWQTLSDPGYTAVLQPLATPAAEPLPARLDLGLRPVRSRLGRPGPGAARRPRIDVSLPLRVRRITSMPAASTLADAGRSFVGHGPVAPGASAATSRLLVRSLASAPASP
jgi:signal peptidase